jgi:hypothetical protein
LLWVVGKEMNRRKKGLTCKPLGWPLWVVEPLFLATGDRSEDGKRVQVQLPLMATVSLNTHPSFLAIGGGLVAKEAGLVDIAVY